MKHAARWTLVLVLTPLACASGEGAPSPSKPPPMNPAPTPTGDGGAAAHLHGPSQLFANVIALPTTNVIDLDLAATSGDHDGHGDHEHRAHSEDVA